MRIIINTYPEFVKYSFLHQGAEGGFRYGCGARCLVTPASLGDLDGNDRGLPASRW